MTATHWSIVIARRVLTAKIDTADTRLSLARRYAEARAWTRGSQDKIDRDMDDCADLDMDSLRDLTRNAEKAIINTLRLCDLPDDDGTEEGIDA